MKTKKILILPIICLGAFIVILAFVALNKAVPAFSQVISKNVEPPSGVLPGSAVKVTVRFPGATELINPADIMLVMDKSNSMNWGWDGLAGSCKLSESLPTWPALNGTCKLDSAKRAMKAFVDQMKDTNHVGLVTYHDSATLDSHIQVMDAANKSILLNKIINLGASGSTSVGGGMSIANRELLGLLSGSNARLEAKKYMVLATDGKQNTNPSPFCAPANPPDRLPGTHDCDPRTPPPPPTIVQQAKDAGIKIYTVGIGGDIQNDYDMGCAGSTGTQAIIKKCFPLLTDLNRNGILDGEDLMIYIANETGGKYYWAPDDATLVQVYNDIAKEIKADITYQIIDTVNPLVFSSVDHSSLTITDCKGHTVTPMTTLTVINIPGFGVLLKPIPEGEAVCISFIANVHNLSDIVDYDINGDTVKESVPFSDVLAKEGTFDADSADRMAAIWDPDKLGDCLAFDPDKSPLVQWIQCLNKTKAQPHVEIPNTPISIANPVQPWLKTTGGDVGAIGRIGPMQRNTTSPAAANGPNADYLVISRTGIDVATFRSVKNWLVGATSSYPLDIYPDPGAIGIYQALHDEYIKRCSTTITGAGLGGPSDIGPGVIKTSVAGVGTCKILYRNGDFIVGDVSSDWGAANIYDGNPAIIFVNGNLVVNQDLYVASQTGLIFVVSGNISVASGVGRLDGIYIAKGTFNSGGAACGSNGNSQQLLINGAVYGFDGTNGVCFTRSLTNNNLNDPAELINFEPKYLWLFRDIIGDTKVIYREVAP